jgi:hypothetical protein
MVRLLRSSNRFFVLFELTILVGLTLSLTLLALYRTDGFDPAEIATSLVERPDPLCSSCIEWPKKFQYLGKGRQQFAFESLDGRYVLKFEQQKKGLQRIYEASFFPTLKQRSRWEKKSSLYREAYRLAFEHLREETGVEVLHRGKSELVFPTVELCDLASGVVHVDLNQVPFVLQKKGGLSFLEALSLHKKGPLFAKLLEEFLSFHEKRIFLQIGDGDRDLKHNYRWEGGKLLYIDPGRFFFHGAWDVVSFEKERFNAVYRLRKWLLKEAPEWLAWFDAKVEERIRFL